MIKKMYGLVDFLFIKSKSNWYVRLITILTHIYTGRRFDFCAQGPCNHNGVCVQTSQEPGYKCRCAGTGYYGSRCETSNKLRYEIDI